MLGRPRKLESPSSPNPWVAGAATELADDVGEDPSERRWLELVPHAAVPAPPPDRQLPLRELTDQERDVGLFVLGAHHGAGEKTLARVLPGCRAAGHAWPIAPQGLPPARVALVARTSAAGLRAAQTAITHWMSGTVRAELAGVILSADAPGKLPAPLTELVEVVTHAAGGRIHQIAWQPPWRLESTTPDARVARHLQSLIPPKEEER